MWDSDAVSSVVGTVLILGITVATFGGISVVILDAMDEAPHRARSDISVVQGNGVVLLRHSGGQPLALADGSLLLNVDGSVMDVALTDLAGQTADGISWRIGETLCVSCLFAGQDVLEVVLVHDSIMLVSTGDLGSAHDPPTAAFTYVCSGLDCTFDGTGSSDDGSITAYGWDFGGEGTGSGATPSHSFSAEATYDVVLTVTDNRGVTDSVSQPVTVLASGSLTYVSCPMTASTGTVTACGSAQSGTDGDAAATLTETPAIQSTLQLDADSVADAGSWVDGVNGFASDDLYATSTTASDAIRYTVADPGISSGTIDAVVVQAELSIAGYSNDGFRLYACIAGVCNAGIDLPGSATDVVHPYDVTNDRPGGGAWTWSDIQTLEVQVETVQVTGGAAARDGTWRIDHAQAQVTYTTDNRLDVEAQVTLGAGTHQLEIRYQAVTDTFDIQVWDGTTWSSRGTLTSTAMDTFSYTLTAAEENGGSARIRILDLETGAGQGELHLDYLRVHTT